MSPGRSCWSSSACSPPSWEPSFALQKTDLKKLLAYSTVSQLGWIVTTIGIGTHAALTAAVLHTLAHALFKSGLFMSIGALQHATGTRDIRRLPPMWKYTPGLMVVTVIGAIGMAGIPPPPGFRLQRIHADKLPQRLG
ncbi:MAG: proton-conducting transporter membrane subunit [Lawsonella clevelandensis]